MKYKLYVRVYHIIRHPTEWLAKRISQMEHSKYKIEDFETVHKFRLGDRIQ